MGGGGGTGGGYHNPTMNERSKKISAPGDDIRVAIIGRNKAGAQSHATGMAARGQISCIPSAVIASQTSHVKSSCISSFCKGSLPSDAILYCTCGTRARGINFLFCAQPTIQCKILREGGVFGNR